MGSGQAVIESETELSALIAKLGDLFTQDKEQTFWVGLSGYVKGKSDLLNGVVCLC